MMKQTPKEKSRRQVWLIATCALLLMVLSLLTGAAVAAYQFGVL